MGAPVVQPSDDLFWFRRPDFVLILIHFVLFEVTVILSCSSTTYMIQTTLSFDVLFFLFFAECISTCFLCLELGEFVCYKQLKKRFMIMCHLQQYIVSIFLFFFLVFSV